MNELQSNRAFTLSRPQHLAPGRTYYRYLLPPLEMPGEQYYTIWCLVKLEDSPAPVSVVGSATIDHLKEAIREKFNVEVTSSKMVLWKLTKPEPIDPYHDLADRMSKLRGDNFKEFAMRLSPAEKVLEHLPVSLEIAHVQVIVQIPPNVKRPGTPDVDREESKKPLIDMFPFESSLGSLHERLQKIDPDLNRYSDPHYVTTFPFPFIGEQLPAERFDLREFHFEYMGRTAFSELFQKVEKMKIGDGFSQLYIQGTMGYGKSHILAVLAGLLSRNGKRVVYLPDCRQLVQNTMPYMQTALLCAFADPALSDVRNKIRALVSENDVIAFCRQNRSVYIIIDQMNALDYEDSNTDTVDNKRKEEVQHFLHQLTYGQFEITSASANYKTAMYMEKKQTNDLKLQLRGGMSEDEMKQWWINHEKKVPILGDDDKAMIEDLTGCIPLLLRPLLRFAEKPFDEIKQEFWTHRDLVAVKKNVVDFFRQKRKSELQSYERFYLPSLISCLTASSVTWPSLELFDHRYFYMDKASRGKYICGLARQAAAVVIRQGYPGLLCDKTWIHSFYTFRNNTSVLGFLVEQACLSAISTTGFHHGSIMWQSFTATTFKDDLLTAIGLGSDERFFIPEDPFFKDIDALYLKVDAYKKTAAVVPIQVTISKTHKDSEAAFYSRWTDWQNHFGGYELKTNFVWIVEDTQSWMVKEKEFRTTRKQSKLIFPKHEQIFVTVQDINNTVGSALKSIR